MIARKHDLRRRAVLPLVAALALGLGACGGLRLRLRRHRPGERRPRIASAYVAVTRAPRAAKSAGNAAAASTVAVRHATPRPVLLDALAGRAKALGGLSYEDDVAPWLGDQVALAAVPVSEGKSAPLLVAATRDEDKARAALEKSGTLSVKASACGMDYVTTADGSLAGAGRRRRRRSSAPTPAVELSLAAAKDDEDLTELQRYRNAVGELPNGGIATAYVDMDAFAKVLSGSPRRRHDGGAARDAADRPGRRDRRDADPRGGRLRIEAVGTATGSGIAAIQAKGGAERGDHDAPRRLRRSRSA